MKATKSKHIVAIGSLSLFALSGVAIHTPLEFYLDSWEMPVIFLFVVTGVLTIACGVVHVAGTLSKGRWSALPRLFLETMLVSILSGLSFALTGASVHLYGLLFFYSGAVLLLSGGMAVAFGAGWVWWRYIGARTNRRDAAA